MASPALILAAQTNGRKSRGPKTPAGKRKSAANSRSHGLYAKTIDLDPEGEAFRAGYAARLIERYKAASPEAQHLAETAAQAMALKKMFNRIEYDFFTTGMRHQEDPSIDMSRFGRNCLSRLVTLHVRYFNIWLKSWKRLREISERTESAAPIPPVAPHIEKSERTESPALHTSETAKRTEFRNPAIKISYRNRPLHFQNLESTLKVLAMFRSFTGRIVTTPVPPVGITVVVSVPV